MPNPLHQRILQHLQSSVYRPQKPRLLAHELQLTEEGRYPAFRQALRELMDNGRVTLGASGSIMLPTQRVGRDEVMGVYQHNRRGFGFVVPTDPASHEDLFIPEGQNGGAITGDTVRARITSRGNRDGKALFSGRVVDILKRTSRRFAGTLVRRAGQWLVLPDGNNFTRPILLPDGPGKAQRPNLKVVAEITDDTDPDLPRGVLLEVLGAEGQKDVDLKSVIVQFNLPAEFPDEVIEQASTAAERLNLAHAADAPARYDLSDQMICTIDPDDAKDYDDAISLRRLDNGNWELGVHIADVAHYVPEGEPLDMEARLRGNSVYFPGHVIPMLPEILSNGVCSLQEAVPRLCKSVFVTFNQAARPLSSKYANTLIRSARRLRYREAQAIIDGEKTIPHPDGDRKLSDYDPKVVELLHQMNELALRLQARRQEDGQLVLELPEIELVLDEQGQVVGTRAEDTSFTHTLIEMFMVEANEAVARLLDSLQVPFLRRVHPQPDLDDAARLRQFVHVAGYVLPKTLDRKALQVLLKQLRGKPESFAINLAVLKSLTRAEYSPKVEGHYALASQHYCHFTSPIRRYADLTIHRLLEKYLAMREKGGGGKRKTKLEDVPSFDELAALGKQLSFTERRGDDAERELRKVKVLTLLQKQVGAQFSGVITGITQFGVFVQLREYLIDGLIRYENLLDDWWDVDEKSGVIRGQRSGTVIGIGDVCQAMIVRVDVARRELDLSIVELSKSRRPAAATTHTAKSAKKDKGPRRSQRQSSPTAPKKRAPRGVKKKKR